MTWNEHISETGGLRAGEIDHGRSTAHRPDAGCNYEQCGLGKPDECPMVKDPGPSAEAHSAASHQHDYVMICSCGSMKPITT